jgi:hypothetical protein
MGGKAARAGAGGGSACGAWLVFVDAGTWLEPAALASTRGTVIATRADLLSTLNRQTMVTFWEKAVVPLVTLGLSLAFSLRKVNDPHSSQAVANGQYYMIRRPIHEAIGRPKALKGEIVEDKAIELRVNRAGCRLVLSDDGAFVRPRMYRSLGEM